MTIHNISFNQKRYRLEPPLTVKASGTTNAAKIENNVRDALEIAAEAGQAKERSKLVLTENKVDPNSGQTLEETIYVVSPEGTAKRIKHMPDLTGSNLSMGNLRKLHADYQNLIVNNQATHTFYLKSEEAEIFREEIMDKEHPDFYFHIFNPGSPDNPEAKLGLINKTNSEESMGASVSTEPQKGLIPLQVKEDGNQFKLHLGKPILYVGQLNLEA